MKAVAFYLTLIKAMIGIACSCCGAEPLNLAILTDTKPIAARACEPLDLRILAAPLPAPVEALDMTIFSDTPTAKPAVKPSPKAIALPELGKEAGNQCRPMAKVIEFDYPTRGAHWTHPSTIRQHVTQGVHAGKLTSEQILKMSDSELEAWHSDDHEGRSHQPLKIEKQVAMAVPTPTKKAEPKPQRKTWVSNGVMYYQHADNVYRDKPEPGACYCGANCQCGDACPGGQCPAVKPTQAVAPKPKYQPIYQSGGCPGGNCPTSRRGLFGRIR